MQIAVIGAGNMGSLYGANLARIGQSVTMVDVWDAHVEAMQKSGLRMEGLHGSFTAEVQATMDPASAAKADLAVICVNGYNVREAAASAAVLLKGSGCALTLMNGLGHLEVLTDVLGPDRVLGGLTFHSADLAGPGHVIHTNKGPTYLGELDGADSERVRAFDAMLGEADMAPCVEPDIVATIWGKFVHNCGLNAICAITDLRPAHLCRIDEVDRFQTKIIEEALALVEAKGIQIPDPTPMKTIKDYGAKKWHRVSMVQHLARGRRTEIDSLNGYIVRESAKLGLAAPFNEALTMVIKGLEYVPDDPEGPNSS